MIWFVYNILFAIGYTLMLPHFIARMLRRGGYGQDFMERLAFLKTDKLLKIKERSRIWIHAVSVGEIHVALNAMREFRKLEPDASFYLTTTTSTGHAVAEKKMHKNDVLAYFPIDFPRVVRSMLTIVKPRAIVLVEGELWPNLIRTAVKRDIPVFVINGRISDSSLRGYSKVKPFFRLAVNMLTEVFVQSEQDRERLVQLGTNKDLITVLASAKYDVDDADSSAGAAMKEVLCRAGMKSDGILFVAGSTWPGEEEALLRIFKALKTDSPNLSMVLVPRHFERGDDVESAIKASDVSYIRRSRITDDAVASGTDVLLADTTGEMMGYYACADIVFVGKSLCDHGGQNIIEPAVLGKPIIVGPNMENFPGVSEDFRLADAMLQVADEEELRKAVRRLLDSVDERGKLGGSARSLVVEKRGALASTAAAILAKLNEKAD